MRYFIAFALLQGALLLVVGAAAGFAVFDAMKTRGEAEAERRTTRDEVERLSALLESNGQRIEALDRERQRDLDAWKLRRDSVSLVLPPLWPEPPPRGGRRPALGGR